MTEKTDGNCIGKSETKYEDAADAWGMAEISQGNVVARAPTERNAVFYSMEHKRRGIALIFNHEVFDSKNLRSRTGTEVDGCNLKYSLETLGFQVKLFKNLTYNDLNAEVQRAAKMDHSDNDCFLMAVLSHGEMGILHARDHPYKPEHLWTNFTGDKCPTLAGKPKVFIIQACQGEKYDGGITLRTEVDSGNILSYKIPTHADFLIAYSTVPGFYSWRNTTNGSWFIQSLCAELRDNGFDYDILTLLTFVCQRVAFDYESNVPNNMVMDRQKQIPCITSMLTRLLKFKPK